MNFMERDFAPKREQDKTTVNGNTEPTAAELAALLPAIAKRLKDKG
jgi:hypothetical protein